MLGAGSCRATGGEQCAFSAFDWILALPYFALKFILKGRVTGPSPKLNVF